MKVHNPMISYHSLEGGKSDRVMGVDAHPDVSEGVVVFATVGGGGSGEVRIWSIAPGDEQPKFRSALAKGHDGSVNCARWAPDGCRLASAGDRGTVCLWRGGSDAAWWCELDEKNERARCDHLNHADDVYDVAWSPCGKWLLTGAIDGSATVWDTCTRRPVKVLRDHAHYIQGVCWDPLGNYLATASSDRSLKVYELPPKWHASKKNLKTTTVRWWTDPHEIPQKKGKKTAEEPKAKPRSALFASETAHASFFRRLCASADGSLIVTPGAASKEGQRGSVTLSRTQLERGPVSFLPSPDGSATACRACPALVDGGVSSLVAVCAHDAVAVYDVSSNTPCALASGLHYAALTDAAWAADASLLVVASADGYLSFLRFEPGDLGAKCAAPPRVPLPAGLDDLPRAPPSQPKVDDDVVLVGVTPAPPQAPSTPGGAAPPASPAGSAKKKKRIAPTLLAPPTPVKSPAKSPAKEPAPEADAAPPAKKKKRIAPTLLQPVP